MSRLRRIMRQQRRELRQRLGRARNLQRQRLRALPAVRRATWRRRMRNLVALGVLLAIAAVARCDCAAEPLPPPPQAEPAGVEVPKKPAPKARRSPLPPVKGELDGQPRSAYATDPQPPPGWLDAFRMQVAARSPRLADCFRGADRPGALRWTAAVNQATGAVSDHQLEPLGTTLELSGEQRECLVGGLTTPPYKLRATSDRAQATPARIGIVIEF